MPKFNKKNVNNTDHEPFSSFYFFFVCLLVCLCVFECFRCFGFFPIWEALSRVSVIHDWLQAGVDSNHSRVDESCCSPLQMHLFLSILVYMNIPAS